jgi:DNA replication protein DnaC
MAECDMRKYEIPPEHAGAEIKHVKPWFRDIVDSYAEDFDARRRKYDGMLLAGSNGCGKTWTLCAVANAFADHVGMDRAGTLLISSYELIERIYPVAAQYEPTSFTSGETFSEILENASVLIIDDLGYEPPVLQSALPGKYMRLLRARRRKLRGCITLVTTNMSPDVMRECLGDSVNSMFDKACRWRKEVQAPDQRYNNLVTFPKATI